MCANSYWNIMTINQVTEVPRKLSISLRWELAISTWWELPCLSPNSLPFGSDFMIRRWQEQFAARILILFFSSIHLWEDMLFLWLSFLIPFYLSVQISPLQWSLKQWWLSHREHKDNTLLPNDTKNLDLDQVNITSQIENHNLCLLFAQSCLPLCIAMDCSMPDLSVPHHLLAFA